MSKSVTELFAYLVETPEGTGLCVLRDLDGYETPAVFLSQKQAEGLRDALQAAAASTGYPVRLVRFSGEEVVASFGAHRDATRLN